MTAPKPVLDPPFRLARPRDVDAVLPLAEATVPGFVSGLWSRLAEAGESPRDFGRRAQRAFIDDGDTVVADLSGRIAAMLICYPMAEKPNPHVPGMDEMLLPLMTLFAQAAGSWYLHGIATDPAFAGQGLASRLMQTAEAWGRAEGRTRISLLVIDINTHAMAFYERRGYRVTGRAPVVRGCWQTEARDWLLMEHDL